MNAYTVSPEVAAAIEECKKLYPNAILLIDGHPASIVGMMLPHDEQHFPKEYRIAEESVSATPDELGLSVSHYAESDLTATYQRQIAAMLHDLGGAGERIVELEQEVERLNTELASVHDTVQQQGKLVTEQASLIFGLREDVKAARMQRDYAENRLANVRVTLKSVNDDMKAMDSKLHAAWASTNEPNRKKDVVR